MAVPDLPLKYDAIVLGTGLVESLVAAALARNGHQVLHLDRNDYYGGSTAVHSLEAIRRWANEHTADEWRISAVQPDPAGRSEGWPSAAYSLLALSLGDDSVEGIEEVIGVDRSCSMQHTTTDKTSPETSDEGTLTGDGDYSLSKGAAAEASSTAAGDGGSSSNGGASPTSVEECAKLNTANYTTSQDVPSSVDEVAPENRAATEAAASQESPVVTPSTASVVTSAAGMGADAQDIGSSNAFDELLSQSRRFNLDLCPKALYAVGDMVRLLVSSNVARYCEFQAFSRVLSLSTSSHGSAVRSDVTTAAVAPEAAPPAPPQYEPVPCGRSDVFNSRSLSMVEKRVLMKLLTDSTVQAATELPPAASPERCEAEMPEHTFGDFLNRKGCSARLVHLLLNSVAMTSPNASVQEALASTKKFLASSGRYGPTPFLWPMYGGEISQAFCRVCAVFSGTYVLGRTAQALVVDETNSCIGVVCNEGKWLQCRWLIADSSYVPRDLLKPSKVLRRTSRAVLITDRSILPSANAEGGDEITILGIPPSACGIDDPSSTPIILLELPHKAAACPRGLYVVHLTCASRMETARHDFQVIISKLFSSYDGQIRCANQTPQQAEQQRPPRVLWSLFFNQRDFTDHNGCSRSSSSASGNHAGAYCGQCCDLPNNVYVSDGLGPEMDYDAAVLRAKALFERLCPGADFLPAPPEDGEPSGTDVENSDPDEFINLSDPPAPPSADGDTDVVSCPQAGPEQPPSELRPPEQLQHGDASDRRHEPNPDGAAT